MDFIGYPILVCLFKNGISQALYRSFGSLEKTVYIMGFKTVMKIIKNDLLCIDFILEIRNHIVSNFILLRFKLFFILFNCKTKRRIKVFVLPRFPLLKAVFELSSFGKQIDYQQSGNYKKKDFIDKGLVFGD